MEVNRGTFLGKYFTSLYMVFYVRFRIHLHVHLGFRERLHWLPFTRNIIKLLILSPQTEYERGGFQNMFQISRHRCFVWRRILLQHSTTIVEITFKHLIFTFWTMSLSTWKHLEHILFWTYFWSRLNIKIYISSVPMEKIPSYTVPKYIKLWE